MKKLRILAAFFAAIIVTPAAFANAATASVTSIDPGTNVVAKSKITFSILTTGFTAQQYQLSDSFSNTTASLNNIDGGGHFSWVPAALDVGTHTFTITARDFNDNVAVTSQTITVLPPPSVTIQNVSPQGNVMPGTPFAFTAAAVGFTNPSFVISDDFGGSTAVNVSIGSSGNFSWVPDISQNGKHRITVYVSDSLGHSSSANVDVQIGAGPRLTVQLTSTSTTILPGQSVSFLVVPADFLPTGFGLVDAFTGPTSISNSNINSSGSFWWTPQATDVGVHKLTILGQVGAFGDKTSVTQTITVLGPNGAPVSPPASGSTSASSSALSALQAQLAALQAKIAGQTAPASLVFSSYLKPGSESDEVLQLQKILLKEGFFTGEPNGYYGPQTTNAVVKLQAANGLTQLGVVGPATRALLNSMLGGAGASAQTSTETAAQTGNFTFEHFMGYGDDTLPDVIELQKKLKQMKYLSSEPTGFYGNATVSAVKKFQAAKSLQQTGYCDKTTRAALNAQG